MSGTEKIDPGVSSPTERAPSVPPRTVRLDLPSAAGAAPDLDPADGRYALGKTLGRGGFGEVRRCEDHRIGREVAVKLLTNDREPEARTRFLREVRIQGQLEHPAVVPVYDLGQWPEGGTFFTMKRLHGIDLAEVLSRLRAKDPEALKKYSRRRLLSAFTTVCLAIDFAHTHGVIHRDLKPANIMLGDFGEVHVIDWGIAKVLPPHEARGSQPQVDVDATPVSTVRGAILGTPGYMAPEQCRGEVDALDARTDVYALGAVLFELLTLHPLHAAANIHDAMLSTLQGADADARARFPDADVAPELAAICARATALNPADRFPSARELADAVERFLDGDRDQERRRALADAHAARAAERAALALRDAEDHAPRTAALQEAMRALALDPAHASASQTVVQLLLHPPRALPPEAEEELREESERESREGAAQGVVAFGVWLLFFPLALWMGVRSWKVFAGLSLCLLALIAMLHRASRRGVGNPLPLMVGVFFVIMGLSGVAGPFLLVPGNLVANAVFLAMHIDPKDRRALMILGALSIVLPVVFEQLGFVDAAYTFAEGAIHVHPRMLWLSPLPTKLFLVVTGLTVVVIPVVVVGRLRDALLAARRRLAAHVWNLRQLLPAATRERLDGD